MAPDANSTQRWHLAGATAVEREGLVLALLLGNLLTDHVHVELLGLLDEVLEGRGRKRAGLLEDLNAVAEHHEGRNRHDLELLSQALLRLGVNLAEGDIGVILRGLFEGRSELTARTTPGCPEVEEDDARGDGLLKVLGGDLLGSHT